MVWNFGDGVGASVDEGYAMGVKSRQLKLEKQKMAEAAIKAKYERIDKAVDNAWKVVANKDIPDAVRLQHYNQVIVPGANLLMGTNLPTMDKFPAWGTEFGQKFTKLKEAERNGDISPQVARASYGALMSEYADKLPEPMMSKIGNMNFPTSKVENIPGPNGTTVTRPVNEYGEPGPVLGTGSPRPLAGSSSDIRSKAIDDIRDAIRIKASLKSTPLADIMASRPKWLGGGTPSDKQALTNQINTNIALRAKDLGLPDDKIHKLIDGTIQVDDLLGPTKPATPAPVTPAPDATPAPAPVAAAPAPAPAVPAAPAPDDSAAAAPAKAPAEKLDQYDSEAEARKDGYGKGDRVIIGGVTGTLN